MDEQYKELLPFLHDRNPAVRALALQTLLEQTPKGSPHRSIFFNALSGGGLKVSKDPDVFRDLKLLCRDQPDIAHNAFKALVNLSDTALVTPTLSDQSFMSFLVAYVVNPSSVLAELASMLLSNLTGNSVPCTTLLDMSIPVVEHPSLPSGYYATSSRCATAPSPTYPSDAPKRDIQALPLLLDAFVDAAGNPETHNSKDTKSSRKADLHFLASVLANISTTPRGRMFFLTPQPPRPLHNGAAAVEYPISKMLLFTDDANLMRRGGAVSTLKNCCFHQQAHRALLAAETIQVTVPPSKIAAPGVNAIPAILLPLAGPEEIDLEDTELLPPSLQFLPDTKKRESDPVLRAIHLEALILLCTTRWGREQLRQSGVYIVVREMHKAEHDPKVLQLTDRLVNLLKREEGPVIEELEDHETEDNTADLDEDEDDIIQVV